MHYPPPPPPTLPSASPNLSTQGLCFTHQSKMTQKHEEVLAPQKNSLHPMQNA